MSPRKRKCKSVNGNVKRRRRSSSGSSSSSSPSTDTCFDQLMNECANDTGMGVELPEACGDEDDDDDEFDDTIDGCDTDIDDLLNGAEFNSIERTVCKVLEDLGRGGEIEGFFGQVDNDDDVVVVAQSVNEGSSIQCGGGGGDACTGGGVQGGVDADGTTVGVDEVLGVRGSDDGGGSGDGSGGRVDDDDDGGPECGGAVSANDETRIRHYPYFNGFEVRRSVDLRTIPIDNLEEIPNFIRERLTGVITECSQRTARGSVLNVVLRGPSLASDIQAVLTTGDDYNDDTFLEQISRVIQSNDASLTDDALEFVVTCVHNKNGGVRLKLKSIPYDDIISRKRLSLYTPSNTHDNLCFSLCVAHYLKEGASEDDTVSGVDTVSEEAKVLVAQALHTSLGFDHNHPVGFADVSAFEKHLDVKILIFHHNSTFKKLELFETHRGQHPKTIWLYLHDAHYHYIENRTGFFGEHHVCEYCYKGYASPLYHRCPFFCNVCLAVCDRQPGRTIKCTDCNRICKSQRCYTAHKLLSPEYGVVPCKKTKYCNKCCRQYIVAKRSAKTGKQGPGHACSVAKCVHCGEVILSDTKHECYIQPPWAELSPTDPVPLATAGPEDKKKVKYVFYDFETRYHNGRHEPNFVAAMTYGGKEWHASGVDCVGKFVRRYRSRRFTGFTFIAHNASGFDSYIILDYLTQQGITPFLTMRGSRVILMCDKTYRQRWIDSFSFLPMRLAKTPSALGFEDLLKGNFPHKFNTRANEFYNGPYPAPSYYGYDAMTSAEKIDFIVWFRSVCHKKFDFQRELRHYGINDVRVLHKACTIYRDTFMACSSVDPFAYTTLASACMATFKTSYLPPDTLALTYEGVYLKQHKTYSNVSIEWLEHLAHINNLEIHHALNRGEFQIGPFFLDGYAPSTHTAYEFAGCFYHGCEDCYNPGHLNPVTKISYGEMREQFRIKVTALKKDFGLGVVVMWECEWARQKTSDVALQTFLTTLKLQSRIEPRDSLYGGRTNAIKLYHKTEPGEKIRYYDFTSLYPTVQARCPYPVGHPEIIFRDFKSVEQYFGIVKCTVLPPRGLFHPVLPYRCNGKLMFPLCRTCTDELNQTDTCHHDPDDRALTGTWVSFELQKAVEKGYQITQMHEVWHYPRRSDNLFKGYVKTFLKRKQEASGYPSTADTPEKQRVYVQNYLDKEGIQLDHSNMRVNKAMRSCNKLILNSLWGRFSLRTDLPSCELISDPERFTQLMFSDSYHISHFCFVSDEVALVQWNHKDARLSRAKDVNVVVGAVTTAHARLMLYDLLDKLQERVLYCDTDSVIFVSRDGEWVPPLGPYLGDLTDEINDGDLYGTDQEDYITEYVSTGPKSYAYHTLQHKSVVKCKGVTLNAANAMVVTQQTLKGLVDGFVTRQPPDRDTTTSIDTIQRDKTRLLLKNATVVKRLKVVYNKRRVFTDYTTLPYGY